jgi:transposase
MGFFMIKYSEQFKLSVIEHYETGIAGYRIVGQQFGLAPAIVRRWVLWYRTHGVAGLTRQHTVYSPEFKLSVLQHMWDNSLSQTRAAAVFNIRNTVSVGIWERRFLSGGIEALARTSKRKPVQLKAPTTKASPPGDEQERSRKDLLAEIDDLRLEVAILKKLQALAQARKKPPTPTKR